MIREVEAFSYWPDHASAIQGFGGRRRSPDPRYCFHTMYNDVKPGPTRYVLRFGGVKVSHGELTLRVHAFRPPDDVQISLVAGTRLALEDREGDLSVEAHFVALRGVVYAFYGYFSEDTDIAAAHVRVELHEYDGDDADAFIEPPRSSLALDLGAGDARPANALIHPGRADMRTPVSQDCTMAQLAATHFFQDGQERSIPALMTGWREQVCLAALLAYGVFSSGLDGMVVGQGSAGFRKELADRSFVLRDVADAAFLAGKIRPDEFVDFMVWPEGLDMDLDPQERWSQIEGALGRLKIGGLGAIGLRYRSSDAVLSSQVASDHRELSRNEIAQWALRLIGMGFSIAPLAFASSRDLACDEDCIASFVMIVQRQ